jgi:hypothetical protein
MQLGPYHLTSTNPVFLARFADMPEIITGIEKATLSREPEVYPNPAKNILYVKLDDGLAVNTENISFTDLQGQTVPVQINTTDQTAELSIDHLTPGIYFLGIKTDGIKKVKKIVID